MITSNMQQPAIRPASTGLRRTELNEAFAGEEIAASVARAPHARTPLRPKT
jgi:hypothetical protein